ncbi:MAG: glutamyl-tRNA synthetase, partial [Catonella sp.]
MLERYSREPMRSIFSDENRWRAALQVELYAA